MDFSSILKPANPDETKSQSSGGLLSAGGKLLGATEGVVIDTVTKIASGDILEPFTGHSKHGKEYQTDTTKPGESNTNTHQASSENENENDFRPGQDYYVMPLPKPTTATTTTKTDASEKNINENENDFRPGQEYYVMPLPKSTTNTTTKTDTDTVDVAKYDIKPAGSYHISDGGVFKH
ncbi:Cupredoxin domain-containing protein [Dioscorea alata]|uniref:Cupredoxin domain-containing protein n=1 Tax=Dioscorea alata TaxID=55571 RepID=A0ACB7UJY2_DIOAL|nr:Cupredoxin domain-containing protein [Dioscorea alata]